jgi:ribosomal protein L16/L10AE
LNLLVNYCKRDEEKSKLWIKVFPDHSYSAKPAEVRMGKGKGEVQGYVAVVKPGRILFEIMCVPEEVALEAFRKAGQKLPVLTKVIAKKINMKIEKLKAKTIEELVTTLNDKRLKLHTTSWN